MLDEIRAIWRVNTGHYKDVDGGFDWWPGHHKVAVRCTRQSSSDAWRLSVNTEYLKGLDLGDPESPVLIAGMGAFAATYGWAFIPPEMSTQYKMPLDGAVYFHSSTYVRHATESWLPRLFAQLSIMQPIDAQRSADSFGEMLKGSTNKSGARFQGGSKEIDPILHVASEVLAPVGKGSSRWLGATEFDAIVDQFGQTDATVAELSAGGVTLQASFGADSRASVVTP